jgi:hypothetical protein
VQHLGELSERYTWSAANGLIGPAPIIGIAKAMLAEVIDGAGKRGVTFTTYTHQTESSVIQNRLADAALNIEIALLNLISGGVQVQDCAAAGKHMSIWRALAFAGRLDTRQKSCAKRSIHSRR